MNDSYSEIKETKKFEAIQTAKTLGLNSSHKFDILEIGCGLGFLSNTLIEYGHNVLSCDDKDWIPRGDNDYIKQLEYFNFPRNHFKFEIPNNEFIQENKDMFQTLQSYSNKKYDYILWQGSCMWQSDQVSLDCSQTLINFLYELLKPAGKLIFGYVPSVGFEKDNAFEQTASYQWMQSWLTTAYSDWMGYYTWQLVKK